MSRGREGKEEKDGRFSTEKILRRIEMGGHGHLCRDWDHGDGEPLLDVCIAHNLLLLLLIPLFLVYLKW